jgi:hypothetical protein
MGIVRTTYRVIKLLMFVYGLWTAIMRGRWLAVGIGLWQILRKRCVRPVRPTANILFVNASEPAIYRRTGLRRLFSSGRKAT